MREKCISVIGAGICSADTAATAEKLGRLLAEAGFCVVCGGRTGVMEAVCKGASEAGGRTIGILPGLDKDDANPWVQVPVVTGLGQMRNFQVIANGAAVVAVEGGFGTLSEIGLALKAGKTVIVLGHFATLEGVIPAETPEDALRIIAENT